MTNNDIFRRLRYIFDLADTKIVQMFKSVDAEVTQEAVTAWLKKDEDPNYKTCPDIQLATFLNALIVMRRGKKDGPQPEPEKRINHNLVLKKLKIAMDYKSDDMLATMSLAGLTLSEHELSAFFRKPDNRHYRSCQDQVLRNFLEGLRLKHRP